jgi:hypothetical protein
MPTVLADVTKDMRIYHEEEFGPVVIGFGLRERRRLWRVLMALRLAWEVLCFHGIMLKLIELQSVEGGMSTVNGKNSCLIGRLRYSLPEPQSLLFGGL